MNDKVNVQLLVPEIEGNYNIYLPINKKIGELIPLLNRAVNELSGGVYPIANNKVLINSVTYVRYDIDDLLYNTDIRNGTKLVLISQ